MRTVRRESSGNGTGCVACGLCGAAIGGCIGERRERATRQHHMQREHRRVSRRHSIRLSVGWLAVVEFSLVASPSPSQRGRRSQPMSPGGVDVGRCNRRCECDRPPPSPQSPLLCTAGRVAVLLLSRTRRKVPTADSVQRRITRGEHLARGTRRKQRARGRVLTSIHALLALSRGKIELRRILTERQSAAGNERG